MEKERRDEHGNVKKKKYLVDVYPTTGGEPTPGRRHRADNEAVRWDINPGYIICWIGILILHKVVILDQRRDLHKRCGSGHPMA